jgi:dephospho-CoA kinase
MKIIGLTGGIGSGKSTVSRIFLTMDIPVYTADSEAKRLTESSTEIRTQLIERFGTHLYTDGHLNKRLLASLIFGNEANLSFVNSVVHPVVFEDFKIWKANMIHFPTVVAESAILFESGFAHQADYTVNVSSPLELRIARVMKRDGTTREEVLKRIQNQLPDEERSRLADHTIINDGQMSLLRQVERLVEDLL